MKIITKLLTPLLSGTILLLANTHAAAEPTLSGLTGLMANYTSNSEADSFDPAMTIDGFFCGQIAFTENLLATGEISVRTEDLLETEIFKNAGATFCINQLSLTYSVPILGKAQYFSFFMGTYESVGSDLFLQRHFGIRPIAPLITETWTGSKAAVPYEINGTGVSYLMKVNPDFLAGLYIYKNDNNKNQDDRLNFSLRTSGIFSFITADLIGGIEVPLKIGKAEDDAIIKITNIYLNAGGNILIGNNSPVALLLQGGFNNLPLRGTAEEKKVESKDMYVLAEQRITAERFKLNLTEFSMPAESLERMFFVKSVDSEGKTVNTLGANLTVYTDTLYIKNKNYTFGFHVTGTIPEKDFMDVKDIQEWIKDADYDIRVSPFVGFPILKGDIKFVLQADVTAFKDDGWQHAMEFNVGYKASF